MMHKHVYKLKESNYIYHAIDLMEQKHIRHIPIVNDDNELIGIVSDRDIRSSVPSVFANISDEENGDFNKTITLNYDQKCYYRSSTRLR